MRMPPSTRLNAIRPCRAGKLFSSSVVRYSGTNLYRKMKKANEKIRFGRHHPGGDLRLGFCLRLGRVLVQRGIGGELQRLHAQPHRLARAFRRRGKSGSLKIGYFSDTRGKRRLFRHDLAVRLAHRDAIAVGRAHHDAFHDGLAADKGFFAAFQHREAVACGLPNGRSSSASSLTSMSNS